MANDAMKHLKTADWLSLVGAISLVFLTGWLLRPKRNAESVSSHRSANALSFDAYPGLDETEWRSRVEPHLESCTKQIDASVDRHLEPIVELLNRARNRTSAFSEVALGFGSKWRLITDYVPFTRGGRNETYLREEFERTVLKSADLEQAVQTSIEGFLQELRSCEGQMLVNLRADLEDAPEGMLPPATSRDRLGDEFEKAIQLALLQSNADFQGEVGKQLVALIAGEVLAHVAVRMGVSAGILGTGAASGWATLGIGVVVGVVIDAIVSTVWTYWSDPTLELTIQIQRKIDTLQNLICNGDESSQGLRGQFLRISLERSDARRKALQNLLMRRE